jgi:hypothetical protein
LRDARGSAVLSKMAGQPWIWQTMPRGAGLHFMPAWFMAGRLLTDGNECFQHCQSQPATRTRAVKPACLPSQIDFVLCRFPQRLGFDQRRIDQVFAQEPGLQFVGAKHITHHQIVGAGVAQFGGKLRQFPAIGDDELVPVQQA